MSVNLHKNGTPNSVFTGMNDTPLAGAAAPSLSLPNHTILNMLMTGWGSYDKPITITNSAEAERHFGDMVFDPTGPFYNYQTVLSVGILGAATPQFIWRMEMPGAKKSNGRLCLEVAPSTLTNYNRNDDGSFKYVDGNLVDLGSTTEGYIVRLVWENNVADFVKGGGSPTTGTLLGSNGATGESTVYPIMDVEGQFDGKLGDRFGLNLYQPKVTDAIPVDVTATENQGLMKYRIGITKTPANGGTPEVFYTTQSTSFVDFSLDEDAITEKGVQIDFDTLYEKAYTESNQSYTGANYEAPASIHMYNENIATVLGMLHTAELAAKVAADNDDSVFVHTTNVNSINLLDRRDHNGMPYRAIEHSALSNTPVAEQVVLAGDTILRMGGGSDGELTNDNFNAKVSSTARNIQFLIPVMDIMEYPFHWFYDLGLAQETSENLFNLMAQRPDFIVVAATHEHGVAPKSPTDITASAMSLATAASLFPESVMYKTEATRGAIMPYAIKLKNHAYKKPISASYELALKMNAYLGRSDLVWSVDKDPMLITNKNFSNTLLNFSVESYNARSDMWANQLIALETTSHQTVGLSGLQSINPNDTSVLNSLLVTAAAIQATHAAGEAAIRNRGRTGYVAAIAKDHTDLINSRCAGIDSSKAVCVPRVYQTDSDALNGYSLTTEIDLEGGYMITANTITLNTSFFETE